MNMTRWIAIALRWTVLTLCVLQAVSTLSLKERNNRESLLQTFYSHYSSFFDDVDDDLDDYIDDDNIERELESFQRLLLPVSANPDLMETLESLKEAPHFARQFESGYNKLLEFLTNSDYRRSLLASKFSATGEKETSFDDVSMEETGVFPEARATLRTLSNEKGRGPMRDQVGGDEGCFRDYSSLVDPFTDRVIYAVHSFLCSSAPAYCDITSLQCRATCPRCNTPQDPGCRLCFLCEMGPPTQTGKNLTDWGVEMIDAIGKVPAGISRIRLHWPGSFEMCERIEVAYNYTNSSYLFPGTISESRQFRGKYCRVDFRRRRRILQPLNVTYSALKLAVGICVPDTCSKDDVANYILAENQVLAFIINNFFIFNSNMTYVFCGQDELTDFSTDVGAQACMGIMIFLTAMVIIATIYDSFVRKFLMKRRLDDILEEIETTDIKGYENFAQQNGKGTEKQSTTKAIQHLANGRTHLKIGLWERAEVLFVAFSAYSNTRRIFSTKPKPGEIEVLNGIRWFASIYLLLGNACVFGILTFEVMTVMNYRDVTKYPRVAAAHAFFNYHYTVDTFFVLSGVLVSYWWLRKHSRKKFNIFSVIYYVLHAYWKIMPANMLFIMFYVNTYRYVGEGPLMPPLQRDVENCRVNWWTNLLLIHNLVSPNEMCCQTSWYLACIFQLYIVSLVVLIPLLLLPALGYFILFALYAIHIGVTAYVSDSTYGSGFRNWYFDYFLTPWCRAGPYLIGMALGIILHRTKRKVTVYWLLSSLGWLVALTLTSMCAFLSYDQTKHGGEVWNRSENVAWDTLSRSAWGLAVSWIIFICSTGGGGWVAKFLGWKAFRPLSRLVFSAILASGMVMYYYYYTCHILFYINVVWNGIYTLFGHFFFINACGFLLVALVFQYPISRGVERAILCPDRLRAIAAGRHPRTELAAVNKAFLKKTS